MYVVGSPVHLTTTFTDATNAPVDPTAVTVAITLPDGTTGGGSATRDSTGKYHYDYTPTLSGIHQFYFAGTGAVVATQIPDIFTVSSTSTAALISIQDAKLLMNKSLAKFTDDGEILSFIHSATDIINAECGYTLPTTRTESVGTIWSGGQMAIMLSHTPIISVQSITPRQVSMPTIDITTLNINKEAGVIYLGNYFSWWGPQTVTYTAGRSYVPPSLQDACKIIVSYLWELQRGGSTSLPGTGGDETMTYNGMPGFPVRALDLMRMSTNYAAPGLA
jgi:hypothetical protein